MKPLKFAVAIFFALAITGFTCGQTVPRPPITGISHLSVYTTNAAKANFFYVHDLGAMKGADPQNSTGVRYYFSPAQFIEVLPLPSGDTSISRLDLVAYRTTDADGLRRYLAAHRIKVPTHVQHGSDGSRWLNVHDPEGNTIQFFQAPVHSAVSVPPNPLSDHIIHIGYMVHSRSAEDAFYRKLLGFRPYWYGGRTPGTTDWVSQQVPNGTDWLEYMLVPGPNQPGIPKSMSAEELGVLDHFSLGVHNMEKSVELLWAGDRLSAKHNGPQIGLDGKWQFNLFDPDGVRVELMEFQPVVKPCCSSFTAASPTK